MPNYDLQDRTELTPLVDELLESMPQNVVTMDDENVDTIHPGKAARHEQDQWQLTKDGHQLTAGLRPFAVEMFCGSGRYTKSLRALGIDAWGIDWKGGRLTAETPAVLQLNLTTEADVKTFRHLLRAPYACILPCGPTMWHGFQSAGNSFARRAPLPSSSPVRTISTWASRS